MKIIKPSLIKTELLKVSKNNETFTSEKKKNDVNLKAMVMVIAKVCLLLISEEIVMKNKRSKPLCFQFKP